MFKVLYNFKSITIIGYYTVDCTIPKYIWTSGQMTTCTILDGLIGTISS